MNTDFELQAIWVKFTLVSFDVNAYCSCINMEDRPKKVSDEVDPTALRIALQRVYERRETVRDDDGQPNSRFQKEAVTRRQIDELIGTLRGIMADGALVPKEVLFLRDWIESNPYAATEWPASALHSRIFRALEDGDLSIQEVEEIHELIGAIIGNKNGMMDKGASSTTLPLTDPPPAITYDSRFFCFTGKLYWGKRSDAEAIVMKQGGDICGVSHKLNYLVVGELSSRDWIHSTHGLKIKRAIEFAQSGLPLAIVSEQHWVSSLDK